MSDVEWKLVPVEPTKEMLAAFKSAFALGSIWTDRMSHACAAMLDAAPIAPAADAQPGMSRHSRAMLLNVLWHHQGAGSEVGQPLRVMLGIGKHDHMTDAQVSEAKWIDGLLSEAKFKNFHRLLCERFGYVHDDVDWKRDQLSLIEHIAAPSPKAPAYSAPFTTDVPQCCGDPSTCNDPCQSEAPAVEAGARKLAVWYGALPESNGMTNWTAILHKGDVTAGITIDRSEYPDRVRYEADRMRWMIGELNEEPFILNYDADKHSGYAASAQKEEPVDYDCVVSICDAHGIGLPVDCVEMVVEIIRHAMPHPASAQKGLSDEQIAALVNRFLIWPLPQTVASDLCVTDSTYQFPRSGTNLLNAVEAEAMLRYVLAALLRASAFIAARDASEGK